MINLTSDIGLVVILVLARIGSCLALLPGFGSTRVPMRIRLLLAVALSLAITPLVGGPAMQILAGATEVQKFRYIAGEMVVGFSLGLITRLYILGLQFAATLMTNVLGLAATPGLPIDDTEAQSPLVSLVAMSATVAIFAAGLHYEMLGAIIDSYAAIKLGSPIDPGWYLDQFIEKLNITWSMGLRLAAPFVVFSIVVNLGFGFLNKFTPQISVYFMTTGFVAACGLILFYALADDMMGLFLQEISSYLK